MHLTFRPGGSGDARADDVAVRSDGRSCAGDGGSEVRQHPRTSAPRIEDFRLVPRNWAAAVVGPVSCSVVKPGCAAPSRYKQQSQTFAALFARALPTPGLRLYVPLALRIHQA